MNTQTQTQLDDFTRGYITAALWSSTDAEGESLDANYTESDIAPETLAGIVPSGKSPVS